jgi:hypothetical protein
VRGCEFSLLSDRFEVTTPTDEFINARCFGHDFAQWLNSKLLQRGMSVSEPIQEDWGWVLLVSFEKHRFTISIGVMDESIGKIPAEWRIGVAYERMLNGLWAWFKAAPHSSCSKLANVLHEILQSEPGIRQVKRE